MSQDPELGRLDDAEEDAAQPSTQDGPSAEGEYDPAEGSPGSERHPVGEDYPDEAVRYDEPDERPRS